jgi:hypothetical protein
LPFLFLCWRSYGIPTALLGAGVVHGIRRPMARWTPAPSSRQGIAIAFFISKIERD